MAIVTLTLPEVREVYRSRMTRDFPGLLAYAFFVLLRREDGLCLLFDYFAVAEEFRGTGIGSRFLQALREGPLREAGCILLEVDDPAAAEDAAQRTLRERRLRFYLKNGLADTGVRARVFGVDFLLLEIPLQGLHTGAQVRSLYGELYASFLPRPLFARMVRIR